MKLNKCEYRKQNLNKQLRYYNSKDLCEVRSFYYTFILDQKISKKAQRSNRQYYDPANFGNISKIEVKQGYGVYKLIKR